MDSIKLKFSLLTILSLVLVVGSGIYLKLHGAELSTPVQIGWGVIFLAGCLMFVRGIRLLGRR